MQSVLTGVLTVLSSGATAAIASAFLTLRKDERQLKRAKLEEVTALLNRQLVCLQNLDQAISAFVARRIDQQETERQVIEAIGSQGEGYERLQCLIAIYFPSLGPLVTKVFEAEQAASAMLQVGADVRAEVYLPKLRTAFEARRNLLLAALQLAPTINASIWKFWG